MPQINIHRNKILTCVLALCTSPLFRFYTDTNEIISGSSFLSAFCKVLYLNSIMVYVDNIYQNALKMR